MARNPTAQKRIEGVPAVGNRPLLFSASSRNVTTFTDATYAPQNQVGIVPWGDLPENFSEYEIIGTFIARNDTAGESTFFRLYDYQTDTSLGGEDSVTGVSYTSTATQPVTIPAGAAAAAGYGRLGIEGRVSAGTGLLDRVTIAVYGRP